MCEKAWRGYYKTQFAPDEYFFIQIAQPDNKRLVQAITKFHGAKELTNNLEENLNEIKMIAETQIVQDDLIHKLLSAWGIIWKARRGEI